MMTIDSFLLEQIVAELAFQINGAGIAKVHQPGDDSLVIRFWNGRQNLKLLLQVGQGARLHLTEQNIPNPFHPPRFSQLLRSRLKRLESIAMPGHDRVVELNFIGTDQRYRLVCELMARGSNLYLLDEEGLLLDALHKPQVFGDRLLQRGKPYLSLPTQERLSLAEVDLSPPEDLATADDFEKWLLQKVTPMSKGQAAALAKAVALGEDIQQVFKNFQRNWLEQKGEVSIVELSGKKQLVTYLPSIIEPLETVTGSLSQFLDHFFSPEVEVATEIGERAAYRQVINRQLGRLQKRQKNIAEQQEKTESFAERRQLGELLLANLHLVKKGMKEVEVSDWTIDPPATVTVKLQPELSPQENAERLFKRYKKEKRGVEHVDRRQQETREEIEWLEALLLALDEATDLDEINEVGQELRDAGMIKPTKKEPTSRSKVSTTPHLNQTLSPNGLRIFWGRNNRSNDQLSTRMTGRDDLWFHAHNMPGCHLVLKRDGRNGEFDVEDITYAARIAAGYSRGKDDVRVEVIVTEGRHVSRPKGAKPGLVTVAEYRTILVEPLRIADGKKAAKE